MTKDDIEEVFYAGYSAAMEDGDVVHAAYDVEEDEYLMKMFDMSFEFWFESKNGARWLAR